MNKTVIMAIGHTEIANQIKSLKNIDVIEEDDDIEVIEDLLNFVSCDYIIVNTLLNQEKSLKLAISARKRGIKIIALIGDKKTMRDEIATLAGVGVYAFVELDEIYRITEYIAYYPESYDYGELAELKGLSKARKSENNIKKKTTVAVLGTMHRIGTTTQAIRLVKYLNDCGYQAIYIESNDSGYVEALSEAYEGVKETAGILRYAGIDMLPATEAKRLRDILDMSYTHYIYDFGTVSEASEISWIEKELKILVCGTKPQELPEFQKAMHLIFNHSPKYMFSFSADSEHTAVKEMMSDSAKDTYFAGFIPDPFEGTAEVVYGEIMNILPVEPAEKIHDSKKCFWRRRGS